MPSVHTSQHLMGQLGPPVSDKKVCVCNTFAYTGPPPPPRQLGPPVSDEKLCVCHVFAYSRPSPRPNYYGKHFFSPPGQSGLSTKLIA